MRRAFPFVLCLAVLPVLGFATGAGRAAPEVAPATAPEPVQIAQAQPPAPPPAAPAPGPEVELAGLSPAALDARVLEANGSPLEVGVWPAKPWQGALLVVDVAAPGPIRKATGSFRGKDFTWHPLDATTWRGLGPVPDDTPAGDAPLVLRVELASGQVLQRRASLQVQALSWDADQLHVDPKFTKLSPQAQEQVRKDRQLLSAMWKKGSHAAPHFQGRFLKPREDRTTAPYGTRRVYNGQTKSVHHGWDIAGRIGDEIRSPADGVVTMASDLYYSGGTVFVDHGGGLYTGYFHMDSMEVKPGQQVKAGERLGTVGKTGRVTGPHLHWAAKIGGHYIHPASLLLFDFSRQLVGGGVVHAGPARAGPEVEPAALPR